MIRFSCDCGEEMHASEENAGREAICPACGRSIIVPAASADAIQAIEAAPPPRSSESIRRGRPQLAADYEDEPESLRNAGTSGKATTSLILGILAIFCNVLAGLPAIILAVLAFGDIRRSRGRLGGQGLAIAGIVTACAGTALSCIAILPALLLPAVQKVREAATRLESQNNLRQLSLAMLNYADANRGQLPAAAICDKNGKPLLSWRVALLPYLGEAGLYNQFHLNEPWDSPHNSQLLARMPKVYRLPSDTLTPPEQTHYLVFVGNGAAFEMTRATRFPANFVDGTSNTILIIEAAQAVPWTKPEDWPFDPTRNIAPLLSTHFRAGCNCTSADVTVHTLPPSTPEATLRALITRNGGETVNWP